MAKSTYYKIFEIVIRRVVTAGDQIRSHIHVGFVVDKMSQRHFFFKVFGQVTVTLIPYNNFSFIYN